MYPLTLYWKFIGICFNQLVLGSCNDFCRLNCFFLLHRLPFPNKSSRRTSSEYWLHNSWFEYLVTTKQEYQEVSIGIRWKWACSQKSYQYNLNKEQSQSIVKQFCFAFINPIRYQCLLYILIISRIKKFAVVAANFLIAFSKKEILVLINNFY